MKNSDPKSRSSNAVHRQDQGRPNRFRFLTSTSQFIKKHWKFLLLAVFSLFGAGSAFVIVQFKASSPNTAVQSPHQENSQSVQIQDNSGSISINNEPRVEGSSRELLFESSFGKEGDDKWTIEKQLKKNGQTIRYRGNGEPAMMYTKMAFPQHAEINMNFISHTSTFAHALNLIVRIEGAFDLRLGDGGSKEIALRPFSKIDANWPPIPSENTPCERKDRFCLPCPIPIDQEVSMRVAVDAPPQYQNRKTVSVFMDYFCEDGRHIGPDDPKYSPAIWTISPELRTNQPSRIGIGLNDPDGKDKPTIELKGIKILN